MFEQYIIGQNEHWRSGQISNIGYQRDCLSELVKLTSIRQIIALVGVRRSGKSTLAKQVINFLLQEKKIKPQNILWLNLEAPALNPYKDDVRMLEKLYQEYRQLAEPKGKVYVFLDEVQFFSDWQVFVKSYYEKGQIKFFLTGSNSDLLSNKLSNLLSGRSILQKVYPFSFKEVTRVKGIKLVDKMTIYQQSNKIRKLFGDYLYYGGFPEIVLTRSRILREEILNEYYRDILYKDIAPRFGLKKSKDIENLVIYLFSNIGQPYSYNSLAKYSKIQDKTVKIYIDYCQQAFMLFEMAQYHFSLRRQENFSKKIYSIDNGFVKVASFAFSDNIGRFLENVVFNKILEQNKKIYYFKKAGECDFVTKQGNKIIEAIQVTKRLISSNKKREINGLLECLKILKIKQGLILTDNQEEERKIDGFKISIQPIWKWLLS